MATVFWDAQGVMLDFLAVGLGSPRPKKFKTQPSAGKVMATVFCDAQGVMLDFLAKKRTITGAYYANLLD